MCARTLALRLVTVSLLFQLAACAGDGPPPTGSDTGFAAIQQQIFDTSCIQGGCHNLVSRAGNLALVEGVSYSQLVDHLSDNPTAAEQDLLRVQPFAPDASFLLIKVTNPGDGEGSLMPLNAAPLSEAQISMIADWIAAGAPEFAGVTPTRTASPSPSQSPTASATPTHSPSPPPTDTPTATPTGTLPPSPTSSATPSATSTATATPTATFNPDATLANLQAQIFTPTCSDQFCHDLESQAGGLVLLDGQSFTQLVNVTPANFPARAAGLLRVTPGDPDSSFLWIKLGMPSIEFGSPMPLGEAPLSASQLQLVRDWILQGANP
jgi:hypothetical protein